MSDNSDCGCEQALRLQAEVEALREFNDRASTISRKHWLERNEAVARAEAAEARVRELEEHCGRFKLPLVRMGADRKLTQAEHTIDLLEYGAAAERARIVADLRKQPQVKVRSVDWPTRVVEEYIQSLADYYESGAHVTEGER